MDKEFEAFRDILGILSAVSGCEVDMDSERIKTVQQALTELKAIKEAKPSEAMECLEKLPYMSQGYGNWKEYYNTIKQALLKAQEQDKALEIIKKKPQAALSLIQSGKIKTYKEYLSYTNWEGIDWDWENMYTEEEFNTLKRDLSNEG